MPAVLDNIRKEVLLAGPESHSATFATEAYVDLDSVEGDFSVQLDYSNGAGGVDIDVSLEVSNDLVSWSTITGSEVNHTDNDGSQIWDIGGSGTSYLRVRVAFNSGTIDIDEIRFVGGRRH